MSATMYHSTSEHPSTRCHHQAVYMLTCEEFDALWEYAKGRCQMCGIGETETPRRRLCIDHLDAYGFQAVRGLLCDNCNSAMRFVDSREKPTTDAARKYMLNAWFARQVHPLGPNVHIVTSRADRDRVRQQNLLAEYTFLGVSEVAAVFGLSRQRVLQLAGSPDFPESTKLAQGHIWSREQIEEWGARTGRLAA